MATYADGDRQDVSGLVKWFNNNDGLGSLSSQGLYRFIGQGRAKVKAFYNGFTGSTDLFECRGPAGLRLVAQPANVARG